MLTKADEVVEANGGVINGIDSPNLMSVDSTTPIETKVDEVVPEETGAPPSTEKENKEEVKPAVEKPVEKIVEKEEKPVEKKEDKKEEHQDSPDSIQKRIDKLTKKMRNFERERDFERSKREEAEAELKTLKEKVPSSEKPKRADFVDEDDYLEALADWKIDQKTKAKEEEISKKTDEDEDKKALTAIYGKIDDAIETGKEKYKDFEEVALAKDLKISTEMLEIILDVEFPSEVMYYLGKNPDLAKEISEMSVVRATRKIDAISAELKPKKEEKKDVVEKKKVEQEVTKAPPPIEPPRQTGIAETDPSKMSMPEYRKWRERNK